VRAWWAVTGVIIILMAGLAFLVPSVIHIEEHARRPVQAAV